jgi:hypothetical protein
VGIGSTDGDLSILQIGLPLKTYIVDAITSPEDINKLGRYLRDRKLRKVVWDGRLGYSELWHRYGIRLENVLDLQLVYLHERYDVAQRKCVPLNGKVTAIKEKKLLSITAVENEQKSMTAFDLINIFKDAESWIKDSGLSDRCPRPIWTLPQFRCHI